MPKSINHRYIITAGHPCFAGHFPGNPIVPGVVILDYIKHLFMQWKPDKRITAIAQAKFHHPLRPDQEFTVYLIEKSNHSIKFECTRDQEKLASGQFNID